MYSHDKFVEILIEYRNQLGISINKMSELINEEPHIISNIESKHNKPVTRVLINFLNLLNKDVSDIMQSDKKISDVEVYRNFINKELKKLDDESLQLLLDLLFNYYTLGDDNGN